MRVTTTNIRGSSRTPNGIAITQLIYQIFKANGRLIREGDRISGEFGLTSARWQVLGAILERPRTVAQIGRQFELTRQGVLWVVQALKKERLIEMIHNPDHKRSKLVQLTPTGKEALEGVLEKQHHWSDGLGAHFSEAEIETCINVVDRLSALLVESPVEDELGRSGV